MHHGCDRLRTLPWMLAHDAATTDWAKKGSTKYTLCGIVLFKLNTFLSHVFACP